MNKLRPYFVAGGIGLIAYALYRYYTKQIDFLKDITYQIVGLRVVSVSPSIVSLDITTRIFNASNVEATVSEIYLDFLINGIKVGSVNEVKDLVILPSQSTDVSFNFKFNPRVVGQNLLDIVSLSVGSKDIIFDAKGYIRVKSSFLKTTIPFEYSNNLKSILNKK